VSEIFRAAYDKPLDDRARELWMTLFRPVHDADLVKAAYRLVGWREKTSRVAPAEMKSALTSIGVSMGGQESHSFGDDPAVIALNGHYEAMRALPGVTLAQWLEDEGLPSFRAAIAKYGDRPSSAEKLLALVKPKEEAPF